MQSAFRMAWGISSAWTCTTWNLWAKTAWATTLDIYGANSPALPSAAGQALAAQYGGHRRAGGVFPEHLIRQWQAEQRHSQLIDYQRLQSFVGLGGIRLEDVVLVTDSSACVLGPAIPKHPNEVLEIMRTG